MSIKRKRRYAGIPRETIRLIREAFNTDWVECFGFILKLTYAFPGKDRPRLEIFRALEEWPDLDPRVYGAHPDTKTWGPEFSDIAREQITIFDGAKLRVTYVGRHDRVIDYPRGGPTVEQEYEFSVELLNADQ